MNSRYIPKMTFQNIMFCTDFSENADFAFHFALDAAIRRPGCVLYLLHVIPESDAQFWKTYIYEVENVDEKAEHDIDRYINEKYRPLVPEGLEFKVEFRIGKDYREIIDFAGKINADLIVMGRQGHSAIEKALFGNVTEKVVRKADCAVLVVPLSYQEKLSKS